MMIFSKGFSAEGQVKGAIGTIAPFILKWGLKKGLIATNKPQGIENHRKSPIN